jgi:hypothetical protein
MPFILLAALAAGCAKGPDAIDRLVQRMSADHSWERGDYMSLGLPATSPIEPVVARALGVTSSPEEQPVKSHKILQIRQVSIPGSLPGPYTAVLVDTDQGRKVVMLNHVGPDRDWYYRVFDEWGWTPIPPKR